MQKKVSAIIPSNNNSKILLTIKSVRNIVDEIIVVNSAQDSCEIPSEYNVKIIQEKKGKTNASKARNIGALEAKHEILLFIDSDVEVESKCIEKFKQSIQEIKESEIFGGLYCWNNKSNLTSNINSLLLRYRVNDLNKNEKIKIISSSQFLMHKLFFNKIGGFNEYINSYEDIDFFVRAQKIFDAKIKILDDLNVYHHKEYNFTKLLSETLKKTFFFTKLRLLFKNYYRNVTTLLDWRINVLPAPVILFFLSLVFFKNITLSFSLYAILIILNSFVFLKIFKNYKVSLYGNILLSVIAFCSYFSAIFSIIVFSINSMTKLLVKIKNLFICLIKVCFKYGQPIQIIQYVTGRCNLRCHHCFYKETLDKPDPGELSPKILINMAKQSGPLLWYSLAGGEPFIRKDFSEIVLGVKKEAKPIIISLPSNGWYTERTYLSCLKIMQNYEDGLFIVFISIDGPQEIHDNIRGENSFQKIRETFSLLKKLSALYEKLHINIVITVQDYNIKCFPGTITDLYNEFSPTSITINLFRHHDINAPKINPEIIEAYEKAIDEYDKIRTKKSYGIVGSLFLKAKEKVQKDLILDVSIEIFKGLAPKDLNCGDTILYSFILKELIYV